MLVVHGTKKFLDRVGRPTAAPDERSTTALGSWYATALFWKAQVALFVNETILLPVLMPFAPAATILGRFPAELERIRAAHSVDPRFVDAELAERRLASKIPDEIVVGHEAEGDGAVPSERRSGPSHPDAQAA